MDQPQQNGQRTIILPPDPVPILNPRQDPYMFMGQSSSPDPYQSGSPNTIATEDYDPLTTQVSSQHLITQIGDEFDDDTPSINIYVAVGGTVATPAPIIMRSVDSAATWAQKTAPSTSGIYFSVAYHAGMFVAVGATADGAGGNPLTATSPDGIDWAASTGSPSTDVVLYGVNTGPYLFMAVGYDFTALRGRIMTMGDSGTWTDRSSALGSAQLKLKSVVYGGGTYVACGVRTNTDAASVSTSSDSGLTWTTQNIGAGGSELSAIAYSGSLFVAMGFQNGGVAAFTTSPDGVTWSFFTPLHFGARDGRIKGITWTGSQWVAVGGLLNLTGAEVDPVIATSPDGTTWTQQTPSQSTGVVFYGVNSSGIEGEAIVAVGATSDTNEPFINTSTDGVTWTSVTPAPTSDAIYRGVAMFTLASAEAA